MSSVSACETCGRPGSSGRFRYMRHGVRLAEIASEEMKRGSARGWVVTVVSWSPKRWRTTTSSMCTLVAIASRSYVK